MVRRRTTPRPPDDVEVVRAAAKDYERAKRSRDAAIVQAKRRGSASQRDLADAAGLSVSRVKQISSGGAFSEAQLPPIPEMDLDVGSEDHDRVFSLASVAPWVERWASEREFLAEDPARSTGNSSVLAYFIYDADSTQRWVVVYVHWTREVYAFAGDEGDEEDVVSHTFDVTEGSPSGPCVLLGHAYSLELLDVALAGVHNAMHRPGGLAWVYGRLCLLNRLVLASAGPVGGTQGEADAVRSYLQGLPGHERHR